MCIRDSFCSMADSYHNLDDGGFNTSPRPSSMAGSIFDEHQRSSPRSRAQSVFEPADAPKDDSPGGFEVSFGGLDTLTMVSVVHLINCLVAYICVICAVEYRGGSEYSGTAPQEGAYSGETIAVGMVIATASAVLSLAGINEAPVVYMSAIGTCAILFQFVSTCRYLHELSSNNSTSKAAAAFLFFGFLSQAVLFVLQAREYKQACS
eukprot:TRINITY_DN14913_c0_g1_i1.p1 TRINITY_DN14913_c0_g1~~TRINITY_DN14913_c0_g1_i1.p1  ORF type:complete len:207 (-),score=49.68 TRINITY_DN14913_c0_g1_i1:324-944(-)